MSAMEIEDFGNRKNPREFLETMNQVEVQLRKVLEHVIAFRKKLGLLMELPDDQGFLTNATEEDCRTFPYLQRVISILTTFLKGGKDKPAVLKYETVQHLSVLAGTFHEKQNFHYHPDNLRYNRYQLWMVGIFLEKHARNVPELVQVLGLARQYCAGSDIRFSGNFYSQRI